MGNCFVSKFLPSFEFTGGIVSRVSSSCAFYCFAGPKSMCHKLTYNWSNEPSQSPIFWPCCSSFLFLPGAMPSVHLHLPCRCLLLDRPTSPLRPFPPQHRRPRRRILCWSWPSSPARCCCCLVPSCCSLPRCLCIRRFSGLRMPLPCLRHTNAQAVWHA